MREPTALTFFSGAGGMCAGLTQAGFEIIGGNEWNPHIADIWDANHSVKCDRRSILDIPTVDLPHADLYHFSPPCQAYSQGNPNRPPIEDTAIAERIAKIILCQTRPRWVSIENVPLYRKSISWGLIESALLQAGYQVDDRVVKVSDFDCPQTRKRFIVRASLGELSPLVPSGRKTSWGLALLPLNDTLRQTVLSKGQHREFLKTAPTPGLYLAQRTGYSVKNGPQVMPVDEPCFTVTAAMAHDGKKNKDGFASFRSPMTIVEWGPEIRAWEVRHEGMAALQGFPSDWKWPGRESVAAIAIGNAVPVPLARAIGASFWN